MSGYTNYISILSSVGGVELSRFTSTGTTTYYNTSLSSANSTFWEANSSTTNNVFSILPNAVTGDEIVIGTGPSAYHMLYRNNANVLSNITLSGNLSLTADGFLDVVGGPLAGSISVTTTSGSTFTNITQLRIDDSTGLLASNPVAGIAEVTYSNNIIYANTFIAFESGQFPTTFTNFLDDYGNSNIHVITPEFNFYGDDVASVLPPDKIPVNYFNLQGLGTSIDIAGIGVSQALPANPNRVPQYQPIIPTNQLTTAPPPYGLSNVYANLPLYETDGYQNPDFPTNYVNSIKPTALLNFYGDSGGGDEPQPATGGYAATRWYTINPNSATKKYLQAQRNFHYSPTFIETLTGSLGQLLPNDTIPDFPFLSNVLEMRNYTGSNVYAESYIGIKKKPTPISDDPDSNRWEWKVHEDYDIDMLPVYYGDGSVSGVVPSVTTSNVINEVNKITHEITPGYTTQIKLATNYRTFGGAGGAGDGHVMLEFEPSASTVSDATKIPAGTSTFYQEGNQIWQTDADEFNVQLTKEASSTTDAALVTKGGLAVVKSSHFGDRLWLYSNTIDRCSILFRPYDLGLGAAEIQYSTSNVLSFQMPDLVTNPGSRTLRNRLELDATYSQLGANDPSCSYVNLQNKDGLGLQLFNRAVNINPVITDEIDFKVYSKQLESTTTPILYISGANVATGNNYFTLNHVLEGTIGRCITVEEEHPSSGARSRLKFNERGDLNTWIDFHTDNTNPALRMTGGSFFIGLDAEETNTTYIHYTWNPNETGERYYSKYAKEYKIQLARRTRISETALLNIDGRKIQYFQEDGVAEPESMNVMSTTSNTIVAMSFHSDSNVETANNFVHINPGQSGIMGFKSSTSNVADALVIGSEYARDSAKYGVPFVGVSNTSANHLTADYATPFGIVYSSDEDRYCYYDSNAATLNCLTTKGEVCLVEQTTYNDLYTWEIGKDDGCMAFANVETTNLLSNVGKPDAEVANATERIYTPTYTAPGSFLPPMMDTIIYHCWTEFPANNLGVDDIDGEASPVAAGGRRLWQYEGNNGLTSNKRLVFDRPFSYVDGAYVGFDLGEGVLDNLPEGDINVAGTTRSFTFRKQYAHKSGWISGVQLKHPGFVELQQGDTSWDGANAQFKGFAALYLSNTYNRSTVSQIRNPGNVVRYLKKWQFTTNSDTEKITLEGIENIELPSEEWVYVEKGDQLPFIHFTYFAGTEDARIRMLSFDWTPLSAEKAFGRWWSANILFTFKTPRLLNRYRGDQRWDLTNVPTS